MKRLYEEAEMRDYFRERALVRISDEEWPSLANRLRGTDLENPTEVLACLAVLQSDLIAVVKGRPCRGLGEVKEFRPATVRDGCKIAPAPDAGDADLDLEMVRVIPSARVLGEAGAPRLAYEINRTGQGAFLRETTRAERAAAAEHGSTGVEAIKDSVAASDFRGNLAFLVTVEANPLAGLSDVFVVYAPAARQDEVAARLDRMLAEAA